MKLNFNKNGLFIPLIIGFIFWFISPIFGVSEPIDSNTLIYLGVLFAIALGFLFKPWWIVVLGIYFGQIIYQLYMKLFFPSSETAVWFEMGILVITASLIPISILTIFGRILRIGFNKLAKNENKN